jgi:hypothetical protein
MVVLLFLVVLLAIAWFLGYMLPRGIAIALAVVCGLVAVWAFISAGSAHGYTPILYFIEALGSVVFGLIVVITSTIAHRAQQRAENEGYGP